MTQALNPELYTRLCRAFGAVKIAHQGVAMIPMPPVSLPDVFDDDKLHLEVQEFGEYYVANCFVCADTRHRLWINHMYGQKDADGRRLNFLATCYNEGCMASWENQQELHDILSVLDEDLEMFPVARGKTVSLSKLVAKLPGLCRNLTKLPGDHKARQYVESRHFDADRLGRYYDVSFCVDSMYYLARNRLVIPIYWSGKLVGWQTRYVGELPWKNPFRKAELPPKYWTMPSLPRGSILPNFDHARQFRTGVLVEGWFDVFGVGPMAMPVLGNTVSEQQINTFCATWGKRKRSGIWLLDPDQADTRASQRNIAKIKQRLAKQFAVVRLPKGTDPGSLDRAFLRDYVEEQAADQKVRVSWERV